MARVNDRPVSKTNPLPNVMVVRDVLTGTYNEVDSATPLQVVLSNAAQVSGQTLISFDDGAGNPITISRSITDPGAMKVEVINQSAGTSNIIELDDGLGNPVTIAHVAGVQTVSVDNFPAVQVVRQEADGRHLLHTNTDGTIIEAKHITGKQRVVSNDYFTEIGAGNVPGHLAGNYNAKSLTIPAIKTLATNLPLSAYPNAPAPIPPAVQTGVQVSVVSLSALDIGGPTGYFVNNAAGYAAGTTVLAVDGAGLIAAGDTITFAGDINIYTVLTYVPDVLPVGSPIGTPTPSTGVLTLTTPLILPVINLQAMTVTPLILPGSGVRTIELSGLDAAGNSIGETIVMNGITPVLSRYFYETLNFMIAIEEGPLHTGAAGAITATMGAAVVQQIDLAGTRSATAYFKVPVGFKALVTEIIVSSTQRGLLVSADATVHPMTKALIPMFYNYKEAEIGKGTTLLKFDFPIAIPAGGEFRLSWIDTRGKGPIAQAGFEFFFEQV